MAYFSKRNLARERAQYRAFSNRQEIIKARLSRRDLFKMGLLTSTGYLVAKDGLSSRAVWALGPVGQCTSPATTPFTMPLPIMPIKQPVAALNPAPTIQPNTAAGEGRTRPHQAPDVGLPFPPTKLYEVTQRTGQVIMSNQLPAQTIWGFDGISPGPTYVERYGTPILVRNVNNLPIDNGGFGINSVSTHLHNGHTPSESDGFPCDFFEQGQFYDQHYPNVLAGFASTHRPTNGDINEAMSTLWYHDHRVEFTAQNVYKGLAGFYLLFNHLDTGNENTGFRLPTFPDFDIPMMFADRCFDLKTGVLAFDLFNLDGIIGDKDLVNGVIQPVLHVRPRRYRLRWLNTGPARFLQIYVTDLTAPTTTNLFWQISNDGNLLPTPVQVPAVALGVAERADVIVDFSQFAGKTIYLENRLQQIFGRGPNGVVLPAGKGRLLLKIVVDLPSVADLSVDPATGPTFYALPSTSGKPLAKRSFKIDLYPSGGTSAAPWNINHKVFDCDEVRFRVTRNSIEHWELNNGSSTGNDGGDWTVWSHPMHIHLEEFQILKGDVGLFGGPSGSGGNNVFPHNKNSAPTGVNRARKDIIRLIPDGTVTLFFRFRDFLGRYPMHCHNTIHEDHAMMLRFDVEPVGDQIPSP